MQQFTIAVKEIRTFLTSFNIVRVVLPYHLHILFGGLGILFLWELLIRTDISYNTLDTLFNDIPLYLIGYYGFFVGIWLTLISKNVKYLTYGLWGYAFLALFPFEYLGLFDIVRAAIYGLGGYVLYRYTASSHSKSDSQSLNV
ncbi:hypothetical protein [Cohnella luojiensis]|uniref:DUF2127 domain-containing protein n=1 Tax=Cohnella luojiensis TaxID=652876 RepID=A0A4Y8LQT3_9BACL|nr:hypothetical protein [Cohnella luojiensis]TFE23694.1 hypothetical protein E2980_18665 [Cohnella luojiensis]